MWGVGRKEECLLSLGGVRWPLTGEGGAEWVGYQWPKVARCGALVNERTVRVVL